MDIELIFPTAIGKFNLDPCLTKTELDIFKSLQMEKNTSNLISRNLNVLDIPDLKRLNEFITISLNQYLDEVIRPIHECKLYVTLSWITSTDIGQKHHLHYHSNSILSGVLYIDTDPDRDSIIFHKKQNSSGFWMSKSDTSLNSDTQEVSVRNNLLIIFPSYLDHETPLITSGRPRLSLSFNTFFYGTIGDRTTKLVLGDNSGKSI